MQTTNYKIEFGFGVGKDREQKDISLPAREIALQCIRDEAVRVFGAYTLTPVEGGWRNPAGVVVTEPGYTLSVILPSVQASQHFAGYIIGVLEQEAVAVTVTPVNFELIFARA